MTSGGPRPFRLAVLLPVVWLALVLAVIAAPAAQAAWSTPGAGSGAGAATVMPSGTAPGGSADGTSVTVTWTAAAFPGGTAVAGYVVKRYNSSTGTAATVGASCSGVITTTTCTESSVTPGTWVYTDTPVQANWTGGQSPDSTAIVVPGA